MTGLGEDRNKESSITPPPQLIEEGRVTTPNADNLERMTPQQGSPQSSKGSTTASLLPPVLLPNKEDYDSSATVSNLLEEDLEIVHFLTRENYNFHIGLTFFK